jgi:MFS family permease
MVGMLGCALLSVPITLLGVAPHLVLLIVATFVAGAGIETFGIGWTLAMQENIEDRMMSRAFSYDALGSFVAMPVGQLLYGPLGEHFGSRDVLMWSGIAYAAIALLTLSSRSVRKLERQPSRSVPLETTPA